MDPATSVVSFPLAPFIVGVGLVAAGFGLGVLVVAGWWVSVLAVVRKANETNN